MRPYSLASILFLFLLISTTTQGIRAPWINGFTSVREEGSSSTQTSNSIGVRAITLSRLLFSDELSGGKRVNQREKHDTEDDEIQGFGVDYSPAHASPPHHN
ncbi:hypothetical protein Pint_14720 [Pistacia integerrima]|uniref:Uncharacterized protein n=1 Tax=Pistacia integerrima TaxID=434235 RepID=A0ACC0Y9C1_9ROSI|nr:hypothetical protein Pint_14720 [Pistacia integerrima]